MSRSAEFEREHSYYRGLRLLAPVDPADADAVLSRIRPQSPESPDHPNRGDWPIYGQHWSTSSDAARDFALHMGAIPGSDRARTTSRTAYGVVLEAKSASGPRPAVTTDYFSEKEVWPPRRDQITEVLAHVHVAAPGSPRERRTADTRVATHVVPPEHWMRS